MNDTGTEIKVKYNSKLVSLCRSILLSTLQICIMIDLEVEEKVLTDTEEGLSCIYFASLFFLIVPSQLILTS